ncbi:O-antigen ligase family protein [Aporhodopirellula aestuarii]|uniref:O-antigen ligase family protein n=1 Tax=Aporhodopirellula aestuarii TaxID=2950107 RepID=A0ABT0U805_9BACT|nr:O-antigen ligase family protein [Aporhodopirellula aestuarii]MCM2373077.1 O-antigen ligase family protein [Aporhodopirellula aestuarii]
MPSSDERPRAALPWIIGLILIGAAALNPLDFITSASEYDRATSSTGVQTLLKLVLAGAASLIGAAGLLLSPLTRRLLNSVPGAGLLALGGVFCLTSFFSAPSVRLIGIASALIYMGYLLFITTALATLGVKRVMICLVVGTSFYLLFTWGLLILIPEKGMFIEYISATDTVTRMGGTGHPNLIAKAAVMTGLMGLAFMTGRSDDPAPPDLSEAGPEPGQGKDPLAVATLGPWWRIIWSGVVLVAAATTLATISRTAILAGIAAAGMMLINRIYGRGGLVIAITSVASLSLLIVAVSLWTGEGPFSESAVSVVTKSGDVEELTSLTGRTVIWKEAIGLIAERPLTGWGLDSAATIMSREATGTHNLLLHVSFSAGLIAGGLMFGLLTWSLLFGVTSQYEWIRGVMVFILISGLVEDTILESFPTMLTLLWIVGLLAPILAYPRNPIEAL